MAAPSTPYSSASFNAQKPQLKDLLDLLTHNIFIQLNAHAVGTIQSFEATRQTARVQINYTAQISQLNGATQQVSLVPQTYPLLVDVPVICLGGSQTSLTFPIGEGDECLLLFNDRDIDTWFHTGSNSNVPNSSRLHSFSDAIALVGLRSLPHVLSNYDSSHAVIQNEAGAKVGVHASEGTALIGNQTVTLGALLTNLNSALVTFATGLNTSNLSSQAGTLVTTLTTMILPQITELLE